MISKTTILLLLLALTSNLVSAAITRALCVNLCSKVSNNYPNVTAYNNIGNVGDKCICKNKFNAAVQSSCEKFGYQRSIKTGNWLCLRLVTCSTLKLALEDGAYKSYDYYNIGKYEDTCTYPNPSNSLLPYTCVKGNTTLSTTLSNYDAYFAPSRTGLWHCLKFQICDTLCSLFNNVHPHLPDNYNKIGNVRDKCICKFSFTAAVQASCEKFDTQRSMQTGNWLCLGFVTCRALCFVLKDGGFKSYDYNNIGMYQDKCSCPNPSNSTSELSCTKSDTALPNTPANRDAFFAPGATGSWHCMKTS